MLGDGGSMNVPLFFARLQAVRPLSVTSCCALSVALLAMGCQNARPVRVGARAEAYPSAEERRGGSCELEEGA